MAAMALFFLFVFLPPSIDGSFAPVTDLCDEAEQIAPLLDLWFLAHVPWAFGWCWETLWKSIPLNQKT